MNSYEMQGYVVCTGIWAMVLPYDLIRIHMKYNSFLIEGMHANVLRLKLAKS